MRTLLLLLLPVALAQGASPSLTGPASVAPDATTISFTFVAPTGPAIWIDGCDPVELEAQTPTGWTASVIATCDVPKPATPVDGQILLTVPRPAPGTYRAVLTYGTTCVAGRPFLVAACGKLDVVRSATITIP